MFNKAKIIFLSICALTLIAGGFLTAGSLTPTNPPVSTSYSLSDIYNLIHNSTTTEANHNLYPSGTPESSMHSISELYVELANLIDPASTTVTYLGSTPTSTPVDSINKDFDPTTSSGTVTGFTIDDIYNLITNNTRPLTPTHTFSPSEAPTDTQHTLTEIYNSLSTLIDGANVATGTTYLGVVGTYAPTHNITFNSNGGTGSMSSQSITENTYANLDANIFTKTSYTFSGWSTSTSGIASYSDGESYLMGLNDIILYAKWDLTLTWSESFGPSDWDTANANCVSRGERLPTRQELIDSLSDQFIYGGQTAGFAVYPLYWSSTFNTDLNRPYIVQFGGSRISYAYDLKSSPHVYRCTR